MQRQHLELSTESNPSPTDKKTQTIAAQRNIEKLDTDRLWRAINELEELAPGSSARDGLTIGQIIWLLLIPCGLTLLAALHSQWALNALLTIISLFFVGIVLLRLTALTLALWGNEKKNLSPHKNEPSEDLPPYTILVPVYREAHMLAGLTNCLKSIDYPEEKLDIKIICEEDDHDTLDAAFDLALPHNFQILAVPPCEPRTKPKALNYALSDAKGKFLTIYDAEDRPEPDQLRKAIEHFNAKDKTLACLQAKLNFYNGSENWLTKQFTIEYSALFDVFLPALDKMHLPLPLGGTSNHFKTSALKKVGAWDAFNLTEDADLGIRLYRSGLRCAVLNSTTYEEANCKTKSWFCQRTRWLKGWLQTYFVHMRAPQRLWRDLGAKGFLGFQAVIGGLIISALAHPIFYLLLTVSAINNALTGQPIFTATDTLMVLAIFNLVIGYASAMLMGYTGLKYRNRTQLANQIVLLPLYWMMISLAAYRAISQLITSPFLWEKTEHGISSKNPQTKIG